MSKKFSMTDMDFPPIGSKTSSVKASRFKKNTVADDSSRSKIVKTKKSSTQNDENTEWHSKIDDSSKSKDWAFVDNLVTQTNSIQANVPKKTPQTIPVQKKATSKPDLPINGNSQIPQSTVSQLLTTKMTYLLLSSKTIDEKTAISYMKRLHPELPWEKQSEETILNTLQQWNTIATILGF